MRRVRRFLIIAVLLVVAALFSYGVLSGVSGSDPLDVMKDEVLDTPALPGYVFVHDPKLAEVVRVTKAVEPDDGWDAQWELDSVIVRSRVVGTEVEFDIAADAGRSIDMEITDRFQNILAENGFRTLR